MLVSLLVSLILPADRSWESFYLINQGDGVVSVANYGTSDRARAAGDAELFGDTYIIFQDGAYARDAFKFNCDTSRYREHLSSMHNSSGALVEIYTVDRAWRDIVPTSIMEKYMRFFCEGEGRDERLLLGNRLGDAVLAARGVLAARASAERER